MKLTPGFVLSALFALVLAGCGKSEPVDEHRPGLEGQWQSEMRAIIAGDRLAFERMLSSDTKGRPAKVAEVFTAMTGLAKQAGFTEADIRIQDISFNPDFSQAFVTAAYRTAQEPGVWKNFPELEGWVQENGKWLRRL